MYIFKKSVFIIYSITLLFLVGCSESHTKQELPKEEETLLSVNVHTLKKETYPLWVNFTGKTQAVDEVMVISRVSGELQERRFSPGENVKKGQILFVIDKSEYQAVWDQKKAILQKDKASLNLAIANVNRYRPLVEEQLAPREKLDELVATQKQLEATIKADEAALEAATLDLEYCDVKANIDGVVGKELVLIGNIVNVGTELTQIVQTDHLYVNINPSAHEVGLLNKYKSNEKPKVKVYLNSAKRMKIELDGQIDFTDTVTNTTTGTVAMRAKVANPEHLLFPGTFVEMKLFVSDQIPILALHPDQISQNQQGEYVFVVDKNETLHIKQIKSSYSNNDLAVIEQGLKEGDRVIVGTIHGLREGMQVQTTEVDSLIVR